MISEDILEAEKNKLKIYWKLETQKKILDNLEKKFNKKDICLLKAKFKL